MTDLWLSYATVLVIAAVAAVPVLVVRAIAERWPASSYRALRRAGVDRRTARRCAVVLDASRADTSS